MSAAIDMKNKDNHLVTFRVNLKVKFRKDSYLLKSYGVD